MRFAPPAPLQHRPLTKSQTPIPHPQTFSPALLIPPPPLPPASPKNQTNNPPKIPQTPNTQPSPHHISFKTPKPNPPFQSQVQKSSTLFPINFYGFLLGLKMGGGVVFTIGRDKSRIVTVRSVDGWFVV